MIQGLFLILCQIQGFANRGISLNQFGCGKSQRDSGGFRVILYQMHNAVQCPVNRSAIFVFVTKINSARLLLIFCNMNCMFYQLIDAFILGCRYGNNGNAKGFLHLIDIDGAAVAPYFIHHVQGQHNWYIQLHQLEGKIQIAFNIGGIHNVYDSGWFLIDNELSGYHFFIAVW